MSSVNGDQATINSLKGKLSSIFGLLQDLECSDAINILDWVHDKLLISKTNMTSVLRTQVPAGLTMGDIVRIDFGINIPPEFSDDDTDKHFGIIWGRQGYNIIVIPLTKKSQPASNPYGINLGRIQGLPLNVDSYAKLDAIRSISIKRIHKIYGQTDGKIKISDNQVLEKINSVFRNLFIKNT